MLGDRAVNAVAVGWLMKVRVHVPRSFQGAPRCSQRVVLHQTVHARKGDCRQQTADGRWDQTNQQRNQHKYSLRRARVDCERLECNDGEQEDDRKTGEHDVQRDFIRCLLPLRAFHQRNHGSRNVLPGWM